MINTVLIIDASASKTLVAYCDRTRAVAVREWTAGFKLSKELLPAIEKVLVRRAKPTAIFCVTGPGSYTGLRIAVSTANALGFAWGIPVISIEAFEIYEVASEKPGLSYTVVLDNIKDLVYVKRVKKGKARYAVEKVTEMAIRNSKNKNQKIFGHIPEVKQKTAGIKNKSFPADPLPGRRRAVLISRIGLKRLKKVRVFTEPLRPFYINAPHVTSKK